MKRLVVIVVLIAVLVSPIWAGGAREAREEKEGYVIALSNSYYGNIWRRQMVEAFNAAAAEAKAQGRVAEYIVVNADGTHTQQISQMNSLILRGDVDLILINAASPTALNSVIERAHQAGIKVLAFDSIATSPYCYTMDFNFVAQTEGSTQWVVDKLGGQGNIVVVRGVSGSVPDAEMYQGVMNIVAQNPGIRVVATVIGEASTSVAQSAVASILPSLPRVDAVITQGGGDAWGVVQAFEASGGPIPIIVGDNSSEFLQWWRDKNAATGYETVSVSSAPGIGGAAFWFGLNWLEGADVPAATSLGVIPITAAELDDYQDLEPGTLASPDFTEEWVRTNLVN